MQANGFGCWLKLAMLRDGGGGGGGGAKEE